MKHNFIGFPVLLGIVVMALSLPSCSDNPPFPDEEITPGGKSDKICFTISGNSVSRSGSATGRCCDGAYIYNCVGSDSLYLNMTVTAQDDDAPLSRAAHITEADYSSIRMTCRKRIENNRYEYYFSNTTFSKDASGMWSSTPEYWWLDENTNFNFYGYAPAAPNGATYIADQVTWQPKLQFEVPSDVKSQPDIVYNTLTQEYIASAQQTVPLNMAHALANITFKTGTGMAAGTINRVTVKNVKKSGTLNLTNGEWVIDPQSVASFTVDVNKPSADGQQITTDTDKTFFMLLPGCNSEETVFEFEFQKQDGTIVTYSTAPGMLGTPWDAGMQYTYTLTVSPEFEIELVDSEIQDAHYVICKARISKADDMQPGQEWELTATADDGADVTLLPESQVNEYQKLGFWTDRKMFKANGSDTFVNQGSARGNNTLTGSGIGELLYIFLPENATNANRTVTLSLKVKGASKILASTNITQLCPAWVSGSDFGWEQFENDPEAQWGFKWNRKVTYEKANVWLNVLVYGPLIEDLVNQHNATGYATVSNTGFFQRTKIVIDYSKLNDLSSWGLTDYDGCGNTRILYGKSGGATTGNLEQAIVDLASRGESGVFNITSESGKDTPTSAALSYILKKNRFNLNIIEKIDGNNVITSSSPTIDAESVVWFIPAINQLHLVPAEGDKMEGTYWSSTPSGTNEAKTSSGTADRLTNFKIRACRHKL